MVWPPPASDRTCKLICTFAPENDGKSGILYPASCRACSTRSRAVIGRAFRAPQFPAQSIVRFEPRYYHAHTLCWLKLLQHTIRKMHFVYAPTSLPQRRMRTPERNKKVLSENCAGLSAEQPYEPPRCCKPRGYANCSCQGIRKHTFSPLSADAFRISGQYRHWRTCKGIFPPVLP